VERAIHKFIPLIRFCYISSEDFVTKVYPFKDIIPNDLINRILIFRMAPNKQLNMDIQPPRQSTYDIDSIIIMLQFLQIGLTENPVNLILYLELVEMVIRLQRSMKDVLIKELLSL